MNETKISWASVTWNPVHGCSKVSAGCDNCYAETLSLRMGWTKKEWTGDNAKENVQLKPHKLKEPYKLKEPSRVFVNSMSDLFHPLVPSEYIEKVFAVMHDLPQHVFQILTKRPRRAARWQGEWTENIWQGTSVENRKTLFRIDQLRECQAQTRFLSLEPLLEDLGELNLDGIHWVIVGGESGKGYRPMEHAWARAIRDQCVEKGVAFFFKQSAAYRTEMGTELEEADGTKTSWQQFPDTMPKPSTEASQLEMF